MNNRWLILRNMSELDLFTTEFVVAEKKAKYQKVV